MEFKKYTRWDELCEVFNITAYGFTITTLLVISGCYFLKFKPVELRHIDIDELAPLLYINFLSWLGLSYIFIYFQNLYYQSMFKVLIFQDTDYITYSDLPKYDEYHRGFSPASTKFTRKKD